ncbi:MAG: class I SAM-dependent methyltransferase [Gammaproteobacteria bacterium]|nr:MAG: class I SAM-dependent methyltransferase [Gammaproteobacteria bacterium]
MAGGALPLPPLHRLPDALPAGAAGQSGEDLDHRPGRRQQASDQRSQAAGGPALSGDRGLKPATPPYDARSVHDHIIRLRQRYLGDIRGRLLDHGFGNGVCSRYFHDEGFEVHGVDLESCTPARTFREQPDIDPERFPLLADGQDRLPFADGFFESVVSNQVLNFILSRKRIDRVVGEFHRVLVPGGRLIATVMAEDNYFFTEYGVPPVPEEGVVQVRLRGRLEREDYYYRFRDAADVRDCFERQGFVLDDLGYFDYAFLDVSRARHYIVLARRPEAG